MKGIIFPTEMHETGVSDNTLFLTSEDQQKEPTLTTAKTLKDYMQGIIALGNPGFATGDDVYEIISQLQNSRSNYHYLGVSNEEAALLVNRMTPIQKEAFNTEIFVVQRTNGTVVQYALLKGEGPFGAGKQQVTMADLVDLSAGQSLTLDEAMSDSSGNSVKNRVIKAYVDRVKENALVIDLTAPRCDVAASSRNDLKILAEKIKNNERFNLFVRIMHDDPQVYELYPAICNGRGDGSYIEFFTYNGNNGSALRYAEKLNANRYQISVSTGSMMASDYFSLPTANAIKPSIPADGSWNDYVLSIGGLRKELKQLNSISAVFDIGREPEGYFDLSAAEAQGFAAILENNPKIIFIKTDVYTYATRFSGNRDENGGFSYTIDTISNLNQARHSNYQYMEEKYIRLDVCKTVATDENGQVTATTYEASKQKMGSMAFMTSPYTMRHYQQNTDNLFSADLRRYVTLLKENRNNNGQTSHGIVPVLVEHQTDPENAEKFQLCPGQVEAQDYDPDTNTGKIIIRWSLVQESGWENYKVSEYTAEAVLNFDQVTSLMINHKNVELHEQNTDTHTNSNEFSIGKQEYNSAYTTLEQYPNGNKLILKYHDLFPENQKMLADLYVNSLFFKKYEPDGTLSPMGKEAWISANVPDEGRSTFSFNSWHDNGDGSRNGVTADLETGNIRCEDVQMGNNLTLFNRKDEEEPYIYSSYGLNMNLVKNGEKKENNAYPAKLSIYDYHSTTGFGAIDMGDLAVNGTATVNGQEVVTADTLKALAHKDQADWETDITNKPEFVSRVKLDDREVVNPGPDNTIQFHDNNVITPLKCDPEVETKGTGNVVIYGYYNEATSSTEIRVKCAEQLLKQLIPAGSYLNAHYKVTTDQDVEETGTATIFFTAASLIGLKADGYWTCKTIQNSKALQIEGYTEGIGLNAPDYNTPVNIWQNTDVLPEDVAPVYYQDKLEFLHSEEPGFKHLPAGGTVGQTLINTADGTAEWQNESIIIPVDFTKPLDERQAAVLAFVQPFFDDGSIFTKPVYAQFTFTSGLDSVYTALVRAKNEMTDPFDSSLVFDDGIAYRKSGRLDPGFTLKLTKNNEDSTISYAENEVFNKTPEIIVEYTMQSKGTTEGYRCVFATGNCKKLDDAMFALHHNKPFALFYQPKGKETQVIPGYLVKRAGIADTTKAIYESGCQWDEVKKDGTIIHHDYKVVTDELTPTTSLVKSGAMGMCYKTETEVLNKRSLYADCIQVGDNYLEAGSGHEILFKENEAIAPAITESRITQKGTGNIAVYTYNNEQTGEIELRLKATQTLIKDLIPKVLEFSCRKVDNSGVETTISKGCLISTQTLNDLMRSKYHKFESISDAKSLTIDSVTQTAVAPNYNDPLIFHLNTDVLPADVDPVFEPKALQFKHTDTTGFKHLPAGGTVGQVLTNTADGTAEWQTLPLPDVSGKVDKVTGKQLSTEDVSIIITNTLAPSYPDGTIVIKTA